MKTVLILGVGNVLLADEGVGVHVVRRVAQRSLPAHVEVIDGGTAGLDLLPYFRNRDRVIIVDAVTADDEPGSIYRLSAEDLPRRSRFTLSLHQVGIVELIEKAHLLGFHPEIIIFGIVPKDCESCSLLVTPEVESAIPKVVERILALAAFPNLRSPESEFLNVGSKRRSRFRHRLGRL